MGEGRHTLGHAWLSVEMPPRMATGAISDKYRGTYSEAAPHATPASTRPAPQRICAKGLGLGLGQTLPYH